MPGGISIVLIMLLATVDIAGLARGAGASPNRLPVNFEVDALFRPLIDRLWQSSPTFRRQCRRLGAENRIRVRVRQDDLPRRKSSSDARTELRFEAGLLVRADVYLRLSSEAPRLLVHEIEHILEQLDGVDLEAQAGNGLVWKSDRRAFETRRAIEAGRRVERELIAGVESPGERSKEAADPVGRQITVRQMDRDATPNLGRTAGVSRSGRHVVFESPAQLVEADRNALRDIYVFDVATGRLTLESVGPGSGPTNGDSRSADISHDGRYVVFESEGGNLTDTPFEPAGSNVFVRDRATGTTRLLSANANGDPANDSSRNPVISADGTTVVFESVATDLLETGNRVRKSVGIYQTQLASGRRTRVDVSARGDGGGSMSPAISADGRFVAFASRADLTCANDPCGGASADNNRVADIYLRDNETGRMTRVSRGYAGTDADGPSYDPAISGDGRFVAFISEAANLTGSSIARRPHLYLHDLVTGTTELISHTPGGSPGNGRSLRPALSHDGSTIAFQSLATDLLCQNKCHADGRDINLLWDVFVYDRPTRRTIRATTDGAEEWMEGGRAPSIDSRGRVLVFGSRHPVDTDDDGHDEDLYVRLLRR